MNFQKRTWDQTNLENDNEDESIMKVGTADLIGRFKSKTDIFQYLSEVLGYYLPPIEYINRDFLRQIFKGDKKLIKMSEVRIVNVPKYDELAVKQIYKNIKEEQEISIYFPDMTDNSKPIERSFFFNVLNTLQPEYVQHIIKQTQERRNNPQNEETKKDYILISNDWLNQLTQHPFVSSNFLLIDLIKFIEKNGRTLQLLKSSSKVFKSRKPRQPPHNVTSLKRFKGANGAIETSSKSNANNNNANLILQNPFHINQLDSQNMNETQIIFNI